MPVLAQVGENFIIGDKPHLCQPNPNIIHKLYFRQRMNLQAAETKRKAYQERAQGNDCVGGTSTQD